MKDKITRKELADFVGLSATNLEPYFQKKIFTLDENSLVDLKQVSNFIEYLKARIKDKSDKNEETETDKKLKLERLRNIELKNEELELNKKENIEKIGDDFCQNILDKLARYFISMRDAVAASKDIQDKKHFNAIINAVIDKINNMPIDDMRDVKHD
jgi:transcriptional regulator with XRE-family HTH domain